MLNNVVEPYKKILRFIYLIIVLIVLIIVFIGWKTLSKQSIDDNSNTIQKDDLSAIKIAEFSLSWLNKQRGENGVYLLNQSCNNNSGVCNEITKSNRSGFPVMWGRFKYFQATNDQTQLDILKSDIYKYSDRSFVQLIQNNFYDCYFIYDLWKSDSFSAYEKSRLEKICFDSEYELTKEDLIKVHDVALTRQELNQPIQESSTRYLKTILDNKAVSPAKISDQLLTTAYDKYPYFVSDFVSRYQWRQKPEDKYGAYLAYNTTLNYFISNQDSLTPTFTCATGLASLSMKEIDNNNSYLLFAQRLLDSQLNSQKNLTDLTMCALLSDKLSKINTNYADSKKSFLDTIINKYFDKKINQYTSTYEGGFYEISPNLFIKDVAINGIIIGLISF